MTARKRFKQRVRARAAKTGEPYTVARRHLEVRPDKEPTMPETMTITNTLHGFALQLPEGWREVPPDITASHWQVATFRDEAGRLTAGLLLTPAQGRSIADIAEEIRSGYEANGVEGLDSRTIPLAGHKAYRLEGRGGGFCVVEYILVADDRTYRLALRTDDLEADRATLDQIATSLRLIGATGPMPDALQRPALTDRARKVLRIAASEARSVHSAAPTTAHLFFAMVAEEEGVAAVVLRGQGLELDRVREALADAPSDGNGERVGATDDLTELVREHAPTLARQLGNYYVGTEHLLLAVLRTDNPGSVLARRLGVDSEAVRRAVAELLTANLNDRITGAGS